ncbi:hypothetical protein PTKIN_Ptkin05aG0183900 [Pterospermum kingtungense]
MCARQRQSHRIHAHAFSLNSEVYDGMRAFKVKTNIEDSKQNGNEGVKNHGSNDFMARKNPIHGASYTASISEVERSKEENKVHNTGESILASDVPELVVFIQESDYQSVKDIFIRREVPSRGGLNDKGIPYKFQQDEDTDGEEPRKTLRLLSSISNEIEQDFQNYVMKHHALDNLMKDGGEGSNGRDNCLPDKPSEKMIPGMQHVKEFQDEDSLSLNHMEPSASESNDDNSHSSEVSSHSEAESGSTIPFSDSSLTTTMCSLKEFLESPECQQTQKTETLSRISRTLTGPSQSFANQLDHGDCGSFAASPLSGPIPCSGSISLRSTSSTASNQSFAFPM